MMMLYIAPLGLAAWQSRFGSQADAELGLGWHRSARWATISAEWWEFEYH